jgi:mannose-1-phosphate guanylyltransferase
MKAMILAAGLGTRLLPYTLKRPKPLFPILNKPLLGLTITRIKQAGFTDIVVNAHHLRDQIKKALQDEADIVLQEEEKILGTGGGLRLALPHFGHEPILVVNGDIYHSIDYSSVYRFHCKVNSDVTLVVHDYPRFNNITMDEMGSITSFDNPVPNSCTRERIVAFTGIHVINPDVLQAIPQDKTSCIIDCYTNVLKQGGSIKAYLATGHYWTDMGTQADYLKLHEELLEKKAPIYEELCETAAGGPFVGAHNANVDKNVKLLDWVCIGSGATIEANVTLQRSVVWDDAIVPAGSVIKDAIVTA